MNKKEIKDIAYKLNLLITKKKHQLFWALLFLMLLNLIMILGFIFYKLNVYLYINLTISLIGAYLCSLFLILANIECNIFNNYFRSIKMLYKLNYFILSLQIKRLIRASFYFKTKNTFINKHILQGSYAILYNDGIFWRKNNDFDLLLNSHKERLEIKDLRTSKNLACIQNWHDSYVKFWIDGYWYEILPQKIASSNFVIKKGKQFLVNEYWQIAMKMFQIMEYIVMHKDVNKLRNSIWDLAWLYYWNKSKLKNKTKIKEALSTLLLSNFIVYYHFPYRKRFITNMNILFNELGKLLNLDFEKETFKEFNQEFFNKKEFSKLFDEETINLMNSIDIFLTNREEYFLKLAEFNESISFFNIEINTNLKQDFWHKFPKNFINIESHLDFKTNDLRSYLLNELHSILEQQILNKIFSKC
ncbi:hypothetical protein [[Mycoplasma] anseris]|uniref:Uncharacterized protein n=1 Tax=[Mycoplasma] anseris TaxID=92400 RepID=A0A2Z4NDF0_9BACT|nr:hypothetical protein [[Mycoplasma] anseris]AWX69425.1 hypothetical protein DP065_01490 [[Mycoplasma] anseris]